MMGTNPYASKQILKPFQKGVENPSKYCRQALEIHRIT